MRREIAHLDNQGDDPATNQQRGLMMLERFLIDMRPFGRADVTDVAAGDALRSAGKEGQLSRPVTTGLGQKGFDEIDLNLIRRYVLRVFVESSQAERPENSFWKNCRARPATTSSGAGCSSVPLEKRQLVPLEKRQLVPLEKRQLVPLKERMMATAIGKALRAGQSLSSDQAALWAEINARDLDDMLGYILQLEPKKTPAAS